MMKRGGRALVAFIEKLFLYFFMAIEKESGGVPNFDLNRGCRIKTSWQFMKGIGASPYAAAYRQWVWWYYCSCSILSCPSDCHALDVQKKRRKIVQLLLIGYLSIQVLLLWSLSLETLVLHPGRHSQISWNNVCPHPPCCFLRIIKGRPSTLLMLTPLNFRINSSPTDRCFMPKNEGKLEWRVFEYPWDKLIVLDEEIVRLATRTNHEEKAFLLQSPRRWGIEEWI